jgi:ABC-type sugar transport system ATPase subunit
MNILVAEAVGESGAGLRLAVDEGRAHLDAGVVPSREDSGGPLAVGLRPEHLTPSEGGLRARVEASEILGAETIIHAVLQSGERISASLRGLHRVRPGEPIGFAVDRRDVHVFDAKGDALALSAPSSIEA